MPSRVSSQLSEQQTLRLEVLRLRKDLRATSAQDQFAKWAKMRRALDAKTGRLDVLSLSSFPISLQQPKTEPSCTLTPSLYSELRLRSFLIPTQIHHANPRTPVPPHHRPHRGDPIVLQQNTSILYSPRVGPHIL